MNYENKNVIVAGASGAIGSELVNSLTDLGADVLTISSRKGADIQVDLSNQYSIEGLNLKISATFIPDIVICCNGLLHDDGHMPEKQLSEIDEEWFLRSTKVNVLSHVNLAKAIEPLLSKAHSLKWISLSAMVGSITDNYLGGWYSYRMTKAALNMFIKGLSIEWKRKFPLSTVIAIHPGTTKSPMSAPFSVKKDKLYSTEMTSERILTVTDSLNIEDTGSFFNWNGEKLEW